jgi:hypothetical protein
VESSNRRSDWWIRSSVSVNQRAIRKLLTWLPQSAIVKRPSDCESQKRSFVLEAPHFGQLERKRRLACAPRRVNVELGCWSEISNSTPKSFSATAACGPRLVTVAFRRLVTNSPRQQKGATMCGFAVILGTTILTLSIESAGTEPHLTGSDRADFIKASVSRLLYARQGKSAHLKPPT